MKIFPVAAFCAAFVGVAGVSNAATVDFGGFAPAAVLGTDVDLGGGIVADITATGGTNQAVVFNTVPPVTGNDLDLASPFANAENLSEVRGFGNALIVQENPGNPDIIPDDVVGGSLLFEFTKSIFLYEVFLLDTAEDTFVSLFSGTTLVAKLDVTGSNESETSNNKTPNEFTVLDFDGAKGDSLFVSFSESGALGEFNATVVPVPASLPLLVGGFGLMAFMRRRRKA